jgi:UDP-N-acetylmuramoyl-tripeptide--D-alanyl-D-alanine ligase
LFFAIVGPHHDGHRFVHLALERGVAAAVVARGGGGRWKEAPALIRVKDTTRALQDLGSFARRRQPMKVIGITGSAGKTTAKEMTAAVAGTRFRTYKSEGNLNNTYGLPLTLLRMPDDTEVSVLEMGMSYHGEIARLAEIADPDVGVLLNVLRVHLEHFGSLQEIARAKGELFGGMRRDAVAVYNADDPMAARLGRAFPGATLPFGLKSKNAEVTAEDLDADGLAGTSFVLRRGAGRVKARLALPGLHNIYNALAAAAAGFALGVGIDAAARALETVRPAPMRGVLHRLANGLEVLDDSYNSNPAAMEGAIAILRDAAPRGRRILVAGDMLELGPYGARAHARMGGQVAAAGIDLFVAVGPLCRRAADAARGAGSLEVRHCDDSEAAAGFVSAEARPGDLVLVKGSRGMKMERVVEALVKAAGGAPGTAETH